MQPTRLFALGAMQEIGKTTIVVEHEDEIAIIDAGIKFANGFETGIEGIIPDYTYLKENQKKIVGLFITHGHEDHVGAIGYLLDQVDVKKIYAPLIAIEFIKVRLKEWKKKFKVEFIEINKESEFKFKHLTVDAWSSQHSIPDSFGIRVKTPNGNIFDTGDFRFDYTPFGDNVTDFKRLEQYAKEGVDILISDSTNSMSNDHSPTEQVIIKDIETCVASVTGKVIFTTFASNLTRIKIASDIATKYNRKIVAFGRSMVKAIDIGRRLKYIDIPASTFIDKKDAHRYSDKELFILSTGSQGEEQAALAKMSVGKHPNIELKKNDVVIFSSSPIPGNRMKIELLINRLYKLGVEAKENKIDGIIHTSGHAYKEEHKKIFEITKPKYFIPYHGAYRQSAVHGYTAVESGVKPENVFIVANGDVVELLNGKARVTGQKVDAGQIYVDSQMATKNTAETISQREYLGQNGFINVVVVLDKQRNELVGSTKIISRGAIYIKDSKDLVLEIQRLVHSSILYKIKNKPDWNKQDIKNITKERLENFFYQKKRRNPMVIVSIIEK